MKWEVQIAADTQDLKVLTGYLTDDELRIVERNGQYFLESTRFDNLTTPEEVDAAASEILPILTGAVRLSLGGRTPLRVANVARVREDGGRDVFITVSDTAHLRESVTLEIERSNGSVEVVKPPDKVPGWMNLGLTDQKVARALRLLGREEPGWVSLYRLYEVIEDDAGGMDAIANEGWATKASIRRFKHTANSLAVVGDASRHGRESTAPPTNPMELGDARALIEVILHNWLRSKLQG